MTKTIKIGIIGCGGIAGRHVQWFLACPECEITALCDISLEATSRRADEIRQLRPGCHIHSTTDHRELLSVPELDAVAVLLPHALHYPVAMDALQSGKHVLIEKPMVTETAHALNLIEAADRHGRLIGIAYQRSYMSEYQYVRRMVETGELGEIQFVSAHLEQSWYSHFGSAGSGDSWRERPEETGGGQLTDCGSHTLAALLDVTRLVPEEAFAFVEKCDLQVDVNTAAAIRFTNRAVGSLSIGGFGHSVTEVLRIVGDKRSARIFFRTVHEQSLEVDGEMIDAKAKMPGSTPNANFIDAIHGAAEIQANAELGLRVAKLTDALYISAAEHRPVAID